MERLAEWFWEYARMSQVHGFTFINESRRKRFELVFWILFVCLLFVLCVYYTIGMIVYFLSQPTAVTMESTLNLTNFEFPNAAACIEFSYMDYANQLLGAVNERAFNASLAAFASSGYLSLLQSRDSASVSSQLLNLTTVSTINGQTAWAYSGPPMDPTFAAAAYLLLALIMDYDRGQPTSTLILNAQLPHVMRLVDILEAYLSASGGVDYVFLAKVIGTFICRQMSLQTQYVSTFNTSNVAQCSTLDTITWLGAPGFVGNKPHMVCSQLDFTAYDNYFNVFVLVFSNPEHLYANVTSSVLQQQGLNLYYDVDGGQSARDPTSFATLGATPQGTWGMMGVAATSRYVWLNRSSMPCSSVAQFACAEQLFVEQISTTRQCRSLMAFGEPNSSMATCTQRYNATQAAQANAQTTLANWQMIFAQCPQQCDSTVYTGFSKVFGVYPLSTMLSIEPLPIIYFTMTEYYLMDTAAFINAFGGLIGWWLGGSMICVVHIVVFCLTRLVGDSRWFDKIASSKKCRCQIFLEKPLIKFCQEYSYITDFHGFPFLAKETNGLAIVVWLVLLPLCIWLSVTQSLAIFDLYASTPLETGFSLQSNQSFVMDDTGVCVQYDRWTLFASNGTSSITEFNATLHNFIASGQLNFIKQPLSVVTSSQLAALDPRVMIMSYMMITAFADYDKNEFHTIVEAYEPVTVEQIDILKTTFELNGVDFFQLAKLSAAFLCDVVYAVNAITYTYDPVTGMFSTQPFNPCLDLNAFTWASNTPYCAGQNCSNADFACMRVPPNVTVFSNPQGYVVFDMLKNGSGSAWFFYIDLRHGRGSYDATAYDGDLILGVPSTVTLTVTLENEIHHYNSSQAPCSSELLADCAINCLAQNVSAMRQCWTLSALDTTSKPTSMPACLEHFSYADSAALTAAAARNSSLVFHDCQQNRCAVPCVARTYNVFISAVWSPNSSLSQITLKQGASIYPIFEATPQMDLTWLFTAFGGVVGLWTGGSILAFIHIFVYIVSALYRHFCLPRHLVDLDWFKAHNKLRHDVGKVHVPLNNGSNNNLVALEAVRPVPSRRDNRAPRI